jgi:hypothetical protein
VANSADRWVKEHHVVFSDGLDAYALVIFENLGPAGMVVFPRPGMSSIGASLGKRRPNQERTLQFTQANWRLLLSRQREFVRLGVRFFLAPDWGINETE